MECQNRKITTLCGGFVFSLWGRDKRSGCGSIDGRERRRDELAQKKTGRPEKLTPEVQQKIVDAIRMGAYIETAAAYAGINKSTLYDWMKRGARAKSGKYKEFSNAIEKALAESEMRDLAVIAKASQENWQAAAWRLERKFPDRWGRRKAKSEIAKIEAETEFIREKTRLLKGAEKDTRLLEALIRTVNEDDDEK